MKTEQPLNMYWFDRQHSSNTIKSSLPLINNAFVSYLWPVSSDYNSPTPTVYTSLLPNLSFLNRASLWLVRDGLIPLTWFFNKHPSPDGLKTTLLVHERWLQIVPPKWHPHIGTYQVVCKPSECKKTELGLVGLLSETYLNPDMAESSLKRWSQNYKGLKVTELDKYAMLTTKSPYQAPRLDLSFSVLDLSLLLGRYLGHNINSLSYYQYMGRDNFQNSYLLDISDGLLSSDNGLLHLALSRGGTLWQGEEYTQADTESYIPVSRYHGFKINRSPEYADNLSPENQQDLNFALSTCASPANTTIPWSELYCDWVQNLIQQSDGGN